MIRKEKESSKAFAAFLAYRDYGIDRSIAKTVRKLYPERDDKGHSSAIRQMQKWSAEYNWVKRIAEWEEEQDKVARRKQLKEIEKMTERHINEALMIQNKALEKIRGIIADDLKPLDALKFATEGIRVERISRGEPDTIQEQKPQDLTWESLERAYREYEQHNKNARDNK